MPRGCCEFEDCNRPQHGGGLCRSHYMQKRRTGETFPLHERKRPDGSPPRIRYHESTCPNPSLEGPCHVFKGSSGSHGYGNFSLPDCGEIVLVHRYVWEQVNGPIPKGMFIDHQCRNRKCCNIKHLRLVTPKQNALENNSNPWAVNAAKTHCPQGHEYDEENTAIYGGFRRCMQCNRDRARKNKQAKKLLLRA